MTVLHASATKFAGNFRFEIVRRIGAGGIGLVYEAIDRAYDVRVALKTLRRLSSDELLRFKNEFRLLQGMHHVNLVQLGEFFEEGGHWFFTMELVDGVDFISYVTESKKRKPAGPAPSGMITAVMPSHARQFQSSAASVRTMGPQALWLHRFDEERLRNGLHQLAAGLHALHQAGMVHRDIKPRNVMVSRDRVVLLDFGLVSEERPWHRYQVERGLIMGTPTYMAPEQAKGLPATPASDWYAVGIMLYEALTGTRPFEGRVEDILRAKLRLTPTPPSQRLAHMGGESLSIPQDLEALCMQLLERDPEARPAGSKVLARLAGRSTATVAVTSLAASSAELELELVGRKDELALLRKARRRCLPGQPALALVHGRAGMGKSALIDHFARELRDQAGAVVLRGRCYERETVPYKALDRVVDELSRYLKQVLHHHGRGPGQERGASTPVRAFGMPVREALEEIDRQWSADIRALMHEELPALARLFPVLGSVCPPPSPAQGQVQNPIELRSRAFAALKRLFALVATRRPLVVIIDDLQWGDLDSVALLSELIAPPDAPGLLLIASFRSEDAESSLITSLRASAARALDPEDIHEVEVGRLCDVDGYALALAIWRHIEAFRPDGERDPQRAKMLARAAARESGGSPFLISEMMRYLALASYGTAAAAAPEPGQITLERVLLERRQQLEPEARQLLDVVAVAGRPIAQGVALRAAGLDGTHLGALAVLRAGHLVRTRGPGLGDAVEIYHERVRAAVLAQLGSDELRSHHHWLATALERWGSDDAETLAEHLRGAGRLEQAAHHALQAARHAEHALAFERAARMYRMVLDIGSCPDEEQRALHVRLGDALAKAGRGRDAAAAYLAAAAEHAVSPDPAQPLPALPGATTGNTASDMAVECKRRAAEQLLRSGATEEGLAILREVLDAVGLRVPHSEQSAQRSLMFHRLRLRLRGLRYQPRPASEIDPRERQRADVCWSGAIGLVATDMVRGADFTTRSLLMALDQGDEARIAQSLALQAFHLACQGGQATEQALQLGRAAAALARRIGDPLALGFTAFAPGAIAMFSGRWQRAREQLEQAEKILREQCTGAWWEVATVRLHQYTTLFYMGEWGELRKRAATPVHQDLDRGDQYTAGVLAWFAACGHLCADDVAGARRTLRRAAVPWSTDRFDIQRYEQLMGEVQVALYQGDAAAAWTWMNEALLLLDGSAFSRVQFLRIELAYLQARTALALAVRKPDQARQLGRIALRAARQLEREQLAWSSALATLVRAGVAACRGKRAGALALLERAARQLDEADMAMFAACARRQWGRLLGGSREQELVFEADAAMCAKGVVNPAAVAAMLAPGFPA